MRMAGWHEAMYGSSLPPHVESVARRKLPQENVPSSRTFAELMAAGTATSSQRPKPAPKKPTPHTRNVVGTASDLDAFLARNHVDGALAEELRRLPAHFQREVLAWGDVAQMRSPMQQLRRHIHDVVNGTHSCSSRDNSSNVLRSIWPPLHDGDCRKVLTAGALKLAKNKGRWYYEAVLGRGIEETHVGWATRDFNAQAHVGQDEHGWAADGLRHFFWNNGPTRVKWPQTWQAGDVIGCAVDLDAGEMIFFHNGMYALPTPFERVDAQMPIFPVVSARGEYTLCFTEQSFKYMPDKKLGFQALMEASEASTVYGCKGAFSRPGAQDEMPPESPRQKGIRIYKDSPFQNSVVDEVVFGRDMDFSGGNQFSDEFMSMYKDRHGVKSVHTDLNATNVVANPGMRHYPSKPEQQSVVHKIVFGRECDGYAGAKPYGDEYLSMYDGAAGKPSVAKGYVSDTPVPQGRKPLNVVERYQALQEARKPSPPPGKGVRR